MLFGIRALEDNNNCSVISSRVGKADGTSKVLTLFSVRARTGKRAEAVAASDLNIAIPPCMYGRKRYYNV